MRLNAMSPVVSFALAAMSCAFGALSSLACSDGAGVPLGGPFGGVVSSPIADAGARNGNGVLDPTSTSNSGSLSNGSAKAPTWTELYDAYFAAGTPGNCAHSGCHEGSMSSPSATFAWLLGQRQVGGAQPALMDPSTSCLTWLGGDMPPGGPDMNPGASKDFSLWLKAGAKDN